MSITVTISSGATGARVSFFKADGKKGKKDAIIVPMAVDTIEIAGNGSLKVAPFVHDPSLVEQDEADHAVDEESGTSD